MTRHFAGQYAYVSGNILLFYEQGSPRRHVSPDVLVTNSLAPGDREHYLVWREGRAPDFVIEVTSKSTRREDLREKFELYPDVLRIREYFLYDPRREYLRPSLQGFRLEGAEYVPIPMRDGRLTSVELGLTLADREGNLALFDSRRRRLLTGGEAEARARTKANRVAQAARQERESASAEVKRLSDDNERLLRDSERLVRDNQRPFEDNQRLLEDNRRLSDAVEQLSRKLEWMSGEMERISKEHAEIQRRLSQR